MARGAGTRRLLASTSRAVRLEGFSRVARLAAGRCLRFDLPINFGQHERPLILRNGRAGGRIAHLPQFGEVEFEAAFIVREIDIGKFEVRMLSALQRKQQRPACNGGALQKALLEI